MILTKGLDFLNILNHNENDYYLENKVLKLSQAQIGKKYQVTGLTLLKNLSKRMAILGINTGVLIELLSLYRHGAVIKTPCGNVALGSDLLDSIRVAAQ